MHWRQAIAYILTTTTYGTWLHGDARGSVDRHGTTMATRFLPPNPDLEEFRRRQMKGDAFLLDRAARLCVDESMRAHCEFKGWPLLAINVRTNHVHLVVRAVEKPDRMLAGVKARATRMLRESGLIKPDTRVWTKSGGKTRISDEEEVAAAIDYVLNRQGPDLL